MLIIGLTGLAASGKSTVAKHLQKKGFELLTFSDILKKEAEKRNLLAGRGDEEQKAILSKLGIELRDLSGNRGVLADFLVKTIESKGFQRVVVDGFRSIEEVDRFKDNFGSFYLIFVDAKPEIRFKRKALIDKKVEEKAFFARDKENIEKQGVGEVIRAANFRIDNNVTLDNLYAQIDIILRKIIG